MPGRGRSGALVRQVRPLRRTVRDGRVPSELQRPVGKDGFRCCCVGCCATAKAVLSPPAAFSLVMEISWTKFSSFVRCIMPGSPVREVSIQAASPASPRNSHAGLSGLSVTSSKPAGTGHDRIRTGFPSPVWTGDANGMQLFDFFPVPQTRFGSLPRPVPSFCATRHAHASRSFGNHSHGRVVMTITTLYDGGGRHPRETKKMNERSVRGTTADALVRIRPVAENEAVG